MVNDGQAELILSTIAVVLDPHVPPPPIGIRGNELEAILRRPLSILQGPEGPIITSNRDQVEIQVFPNKFDVRESSGDVTQARSKIPRIMHGFLSISSEVKIQSYGVNFLVEINLERPREWLGNNLLHPDLASEFGTSFSSDLVTLMLDRSPKTWTVRFQAQPSDGISVNFNASEITSELPDQEELGHEIEEQYQALNGFLSQIGL